jgi:hypothetical protein
MQSPQTGRRDARADTLTHLQTRLSFRVSIHTLGQYSVPALIEKQVSQVGKVDLVLMVHGLSVLGHQRRSTQLCTPECRLGVATVPLPPGLGLISLRLSNMSETRLSFVERSMIRGAKRPWFTDSADEPCLVPMPIDLTVLPSSCRVSALSPRSEGRADRCPQPHHLSTDLPRNGLVLSANCGEPQCADFERDTLREKRGNTPRRANTSATRRKACGGTMPGRPARGFGTERLLTAAKRRPSHRQMPLRLR